jgi:hypothetical protein
MERTTTKSVLLNHVISGIIGCIIIVLIGCLSNFLEKNTKIYLNGNWNMLITPSGPGKKSTLGTCTIRQIKGQNILSFVGEFSEITDSVKNPTFKINSQFAGLNEETVYFIYQNERKEEGVFKGKIQGTRPSKFTVDYCDLDRNSCNSFTGDMNNDVCGKIEFSRVDYNFYDNIKNNKEILIIAVLVVILSILIYVNYHRVNETKKELLEGSKQF